MPLYTRMLMSKSADLQKDISENRAKEPITSVTPLGKLLEQVRNKLPGGASYK